MPVGRATAITINHSRQQKINNLLLLLLSITVTMSDLNETAQVSEEESGSATEESLHRKKHSNPVVSRTVEFQGMTRTSNSEDDGGPPIASSSQTSDISGDEEEASVGKDGTDTLKLPKKKKGMSAKERSMLRKGKWTVSL